jgi:hypothetical protein
MAGSRSPLSDDSTARRAALKQRAAAARGRATATKAWTAQITAAAAGTMWRVTSAWIQEADGIRCADLTNVSSGKLRTIRVTGEETAEACRACIISE